MFGVNLVDLGAGGADEQDGYHRQAQSKTMQH
jgi:hypothetical protein